MTKRAKGYEKTGIVMRRCSGRCVATNLMQVIASRMSSRSTVLPSLLVFFTCFFLTREKIPKLSGIQRITIFKITEVMFYLFLNWQDSQDIIKMIVCSKLTAFPLPVCLIPESRWSQRENMSWGSGVLH